MRYDETIGARLEHANRELAATRKRAATLEAFVRRFAQSSECACQDMFHECMHCRAARLVPGAVKREGNS